MMLVAALVTVWVYDRLFGLSSLSGETSAQDGGSGRLRIAGLAILGVVAKTSAVVADAVRKVIGTRGTSRLLPIYCTLALVFLVLPTLLVIPIGFTSSQFLEFPPPGLSLQWFETYFSSPVWLAATLRSFGVAIATAICATLIGGLAALALARSKTRWGGLVFATFLAPLIVPRIIIAVGLFYLFARIGLVATDLGLVIGHTVLALPFAFVTITAILKNYDWRLDQAAAVLGANRVKTLLLVTVPLELTIAIFVSGGIKTTLPKQMWDDMILQLNPTLAAVSVVVFVIVTVLLLLAERFRRTT
jgi:ABC-type spermidine/putrescine transport system permease subunit II